MSIPSIHVKDDLTYDQALQCGTILSMSPLTDDPLLQLRPNVLLDCLRVC